ncbi:hypothetical protein PYCCODRAFT_1464498 [Trametes coccinea BRFM310]|uniref:Uncharacterized protein n=1 Tax=Trametes coccinea (strain BRFM310) TaxID=1353009 RepID=A0A1Y2J2A8_TRAC3|nr:hypothetical protein PYCCODRAFT_1464498 [Trametes coccinea BRFM310]
MYSSRPTYNSPPPELSNNPFIDHSANALARFPDISATDDLSGSSGQYTSWMNRPQTSAINTNQTGYFPQGVASPVGYGGGSYQAQQPNGWAPGGSGFSQPTPQPPYGQMMSPPPVQTQASGPFQPSSAFGQQLSGQLNGAYGGAVPQQQPQFSGYPTSQQYGQGYQQGYPGQQQQQPSQYLAEFDPYAQSQGSQASAPPPVGPGGQYNRQHPRQFVQSHKAELESWDSYTWKQAQNSFEQLKSAWEARKQELEARLRAMGGAGLFSGGGYGGMYGGPAQQYAQLENMAKEAGLHVDTVAAGAFQMQEVFTGYRQSSDIASKRRVREAINAALSSLPDWPQPLMF